MKDFENINTIDEFWNKLKNEVAKDAEIYKLELMRAVFYTACAGMYAIMKFNIFEKNTDIRTKIDFMRLVEKEIHDFCDEISDDLPKNVKH